MRASVEKRLPLARLERWLQAEIARPTEGAASGAPAASRLVLPSRHLTPKRRVAIYGEMYFARLVDCLREDYPAVAKLAGAEDFERLVRGYLRRHPSRHYSLAFLGQHLPAFLRGSARIPRRALLADVARLERAMSEVFDAPASPSLSPAELALIPPEVWERGRLRLVEAFRPCAFDHRANAIVTACRQGKPLPDLGRKRTWVAVYRKEWQVWRMDLTQPMHAILSALHGGARLSDALEAAARTSRGDADELQANVYRWFREWATEGCFSAVERSTSAR